MRLLNAVILILYGTAVNAVDPKEIYDGGYNSTTSPLLLRIANGGAGQSGLVKALADAFIQESVNNGSLPFQLGWVLSDTTFSIKYLQSGDADVGITYNKAAEMIAVKGDIVDPKTYYIFRDHFLVVGPPENPANVNSSMEIIPLFARLFEAADLANTTIPTRFLTRYDKSATNIKESELWLGIGQVPWATPYTTWYHQYIGFPIQALTAAIQLKEYTLTDRGTYLSLDKALSNRTVIYKASTDNETDLLLNPAHLLVGRKAKNLTMAYQFANWCVSRNGQRVISNFKKNGEQLYTGAP
ncbi:extracellular solute-binding protein family 1 [Colletotrichum graminicola]|uniref:Extracellular solute-binding protein family 1 n=1 Tax=Colletotrichum graminicola (strain M1.001 / M2 / FGSC 10212) TaxID=645133 RepID=E3Q5K0_COLGM|nr:extracellular solute-binding protein family 1 [Colletotrichum graminicola M1.001]EFQ25967.1 extracellular solute-binding protein family 1 [Colletotrichum graminicola M1.001]WDK23087.1 extracellular solute-binding protein family 1 [Colletotrichum graminicola]